jgi:hypothetical protein
MQRKNLLAAAVVVSFLFACATGPTIKRDAVQQDKKVAIIGFSGLITYQDSNAGNLQIINTINTVGSAASGQSAALRQAEAQKLYGDLVQKLSSAAGWEVVGHEQLPSHPEYQQLIAANPLPSERMADRLQHLPDVLRYETTDGLDAGKRAELAKALGVDAVATVRFLYSEGSKESPSFGVQEMKPVAVIQFDVYDAKTNALIWSDHHAVGQQPAHGIMDKLGVKTSSGAEESAVLTDAGDSAIDALVTRYQQAH